jgi:two-component system sensor histidine kinase KdpD
MASLETRAVTAEIEWVPPADILEAARQQAVTALAVRDIVIHGDAEPRLVQIDPRLTSAAVAHVLENAAAYSPPAAPIEIGVRVGEGELVIAVRDHGPGLPPQDVERVFERFYRGTGSSDRFGTGMGLAIARGLIALQGGRITVANHAAGGAIFTLAIPVATRAAVEITLLQPSNSSTTSCRFSVRLPRCCDLAAIR